MKTNIEQIERLADAAGGEWWSQGRTLRTRITERWSDEEFSRNDAIERRMVFARFSPRDEGASRELVATAEKPEFSEYIAALSPPVVKQWAEETRELREQLSDLRADHRNLLDKKNELKARVRELEGAMQRIADLPRDDSSPEVAYFATQRIIKEVLPHD